MRHYALLVPTGQPHTRRMNAHEQMAGPKASAVSQQTAHVCRHRRILQEQGALEKLAAMETRAKDEVTVQQRAGFAEEIEDLVHEK